MIFKRSKGKGIFALTSASITLEVKLGFKSSNKGAICLKEASGAFRNALHDVRGLLEVSEELRYREVRDRYGYIWFIVYANSLEDVVACMDAIIDIVGEHGYKANILACIFEFINSRKVYLIYRNDKFYPFIPDRRFRDVDDELRVSAILKDELPIEEDMEKWYPIWNMPI